MQPEIYTLPTLSFVGGATQEMRFRLKDKYGNIIDASGCSAEFAVCDYRYKNGTYLFRENVEFIQDEHKVQSILRVVINANNTRDKYGKYVYQITINDGTGRYCIPNQGILNITKNIDQSYR